MTKKAETKDFFKDERYGIWWLLLQTRRVLHEARRMELDQYKISPAQEAIMLAINLCGRDATVSEISRWILRKPHTIGEAIAKMEKDGLVVREKDVRGARIKIKLTRAGLKAYNQTLKRESISEIMSCLTKTECKQFESILRKLRDRATTRIASTNFHPLP